MSQRPSYICKAIIIQLQYLCGVEDGYTKCIESGCGRNVLHHLAQSIVGLDRQEAQGNELDLEDETSEARCTKLHVSCWVIG